MSVRYSTYLTLREMISDLRRKAQDLPKTVKTPQFVDQSVGLWLKSGRNSETLTSGVLIDEEDYLKCGSKIFFPENSDFLHMLWNAKMDVLPSDIINIPRCFSLAWPDDFSIDGVKLPGVLVWLGTGKERMSSFRAFEKKYLGDNYNQVADREDIRYLNISYWISGDDDKASIMRCCVPEDKLAICLKDHENLMDTVGLMKAYMVDSLSEEDQKEQFILIKLITHLLVYATACPESILPGWPDKYSHKDIGKGFFKTFSPFRMMSPVRRREGSSPSTHWRNWCFRKYPVKKDGTRREGLIFVSGCLVNGNVEPHTVVQV